MLRTGTRSGRLRLVAVLVAACVVLGVPLGGSAALADTFSSPATGAHQVIGAILARYQATGGPAGIHGFPVTDELSTPDGRGRFNLFQGGSIYWTPATGAHSVYGAIRDRWAQLGWETSALGYPVSDEYSVPGGRAQDFQYGSLGWTPDGGTFFRGAGTAGGGPLPLGVTPPGSQAITVTAAPGATAGTLTAWERGSDGSWRPVLGPIPARVGSAGIGIASETVARTPAGTYRLTEAFGRQANPGTALPYRRVDGNDWWVGDSRSGLYNQYARCAPGSCPFDERVSENLYAVGPVYDDAVVIDYNRPNAVPGAGSAFFLHIANQYATGGCVAIDAGSLQAIMRWLRPDASPVISMGIG